ncbi:MAG: hypothetical protein ACRBN8_22445 [Nannocystales bacterium]
MRTESLETKGGTWMAARRKLEEKKLSELLADREVCQTITFRGQRYRLASLCMAELEELAREMAVVAVRRAMTKAAA